MILDSAYDFYCLLTSDKTTPGDFEKSVISWANRTVMTDETYRAFKIRYCDSKSFGQSPI